MRTLIDAANLHVGGGVQVACSVITELQRLEDQFPWLRQAEIRASSQVWENLSAERRARVVRRDDRPGPFFLRPRASRPFDAELIIFGPVYRPVAGRVSVAGCADPSVARDSPICPNSLTAHAKVRLKRQLLRRHDHLWVESSSFADSLRGSGLRRVGMTVIPNAPAEVEPEVVAIPTGGSDLTLFYPARFYPHKNHDFLGQVAAQLKRSRGLEARFLVTLTSDELARCSSQTRAVCVPLGHLSLAECHGVYGQVDGVFFPSLSEVSSATPYEAMRYGTPMLLSDRSFLREPTEGAARYFDPLDPEDGARAIVRLVDLREETKLLVERGMNVIENHMNAAGRARALCELLERAHR